MLYRPAVAVVLGAVSTVGIVTQHQSSFTPGLIVAYVSAFGALVTSAASLIAIFKRRDPTVLIVRSEEEAERMTLAHEHGKHRKGHDDDAS